MATLTTQFEQAMREVEKQAAIRLIKAAITLQVEMMRLLNISNPPPHDNPAPRGDYPRKRTGNLQGQIGYSPTSITDVVREKSIKVGYGKQGFYGIALARRGWKSIRNAAHEIRQKLQKILEG